MKIAIRGGHNFSVKGATGIFDETTEDRKVKDAVIKYLRIAGHEVIDVTPTDSYNTVLSDLQFGVNLAEKEQVDLFMSCHFDKAHDTNSWSGSMGTACWILGTGGQAEAIGAKVCKAVADGTGFINRGIHVDAELYELRKTTMPAIICETCFCEATGDAEIYFKVGADEIGRLIASGINGADIKAPAAPAYTPAADTTLKPDVNKPADIENKDQYGIITADILNVRAKGSLSADIIGTLKKGDKVKLAVKVGDWWNIYFSEHGGFIYSQYVNVI